MQTVKSSIVISTIFPEIKDDQILEKLRLPRGVVLMYSPDYCEIELYRDENIKDKSEIITRNKRLIWARFVKETHGEEEIIIFLFSPILEKFVPDYNRIFHFPFLKNKLFRNIITVYMN